MVCSKKLLLQNRQPNPSRPLEHRLFLRPLSVVHPQMVLVLLQNLNEMREGYADNLYAIRQQWYPVVKWLTSSSGLYNKSPQSSLHPMNRTPPRTPASVGDLDGITLLPFRTVATHLQVFHDIIMGSQTAVLSKGLDTPSVDDVSIDHH